MVFKDMHLKISSAKRLPFCLGLNVLIYRLSMPHPIRHNYEHPTIRRSVCIVFVDCNPVIRFAKWCEQGAIAVTIVVGNVYPDSKVHGANMGSIWGRQDPGAPHVGPINIVIWDHNVLMLSPTKSSFLRAEILLVNSVGNMFCKRVSGAVIW